MTIVTDLIGRALDQLAAHPIVSILVVIGGWKVLWWVIDRAEKLYDWARQMPAYNEGLDGNEGFLTPGITWLLLAAAGAEPLRARPWAAPSVDTGKLWTLGGRVLPGNIALPDQPDELVFLGWLDNASFSGMESAEDRAQVMVTDAGQRALELIQAGDHRGYARHLRDSARAARARRRDTERSAA